MAPQERLSRRLFSYADCNPEVSERSRLQDLMEIAEERAKEATRLLPSPKGPFDGPQIGVDWRSAVCERNQENAYFIACQ